MDSSAGFLLYAALYRLTVLTVGALSIWLGFRLFSAAGSKAADGAGLASAEAGSVKLSFTNLLPGTYFALFGTTIIGMMLWKGEPQFLQQELVGMAEKENAAAISKPEPVQLSAAPAETHTRTLAMRGSGANLDGKADADTEWDKLNPSVTLTEAAEPLSKIARIWHSENRIGEALALARLAVLYGKEENKVALLTLLAELLRADGQKEDAAKAEQIAADLRRMEKR